MLKFYRASILAFAAIVSSSAFAIGPTGTVADYGSPAPGVAAARTITVTPSTRWVHVVNGETVNFVVGGKSFGWHVDTYTNVNEFPLRTIVPAADGVRVLVAPNPVYAGS